MYCLYVISKSLVSMYYVDSETKYKAVNMLEGFTITPSTVDCRFAEGKLMVDAVASSAKDVNKADHFVKMLSLR